MSEFWLADRQGMTLTLEDGPHDDASGVHEARYLLERVFGVRPEKNYVVVEISEAEARPTADTNEGALDACRDMVKRGNRGGHKS